jgi:hypothetical protein
MQTVIAKSENFIDYLSGYIKNIHPSVANLSSQYKGGCGASTAVSKSQHSDQLSDSFQSK